MEEVKGLKRQIKILLGTPPSSSHPSCSKVTKQNTWLGPCKHCGFKNHLFDDCYSKPKCSTCGSTNHLTKEHLKHVVVKKTLSKLKAQSPLKPSPKKAPMIPKPFKECKYCGFNDHHSDHYEFYPGCEDYLKRSVWYLDSGCSRHIIGIIQYLHRYSKESSPKVVFGDDSSGDTEGSVKPQTICHNKYTLVIIDEYSRYTWVFCLKKKSDAVDGIMSFIRKMENLNEVRVKELRSDNGTEFRN
ncbi:retrovirus-related pol polyprotein from transposon TNT 1-94, partial [Tanacetum coccineum]